MIYDKGFKKSNGVYYTNSVVADFMILKLEIDYTKPFRLLELAVGEGHIFNRIVKTYIEHRIMHVSKKKLKLELESNFYAFDKDFDSINRCISSLNRLVNELLEIDDVRWSIFNIDIFNLDDLLRLGSFDYVISNPPYVSRRNLKDQLQVTFLRNNSLFCKKHNYDLYYYFFEVAIRLWNRMGSVVLITPNSFLRATSAIPLRDFITKKKILHEVIDFEDSLLFEDASAYTAITVLRNNSYKYNLYRGVYDKKEIKPILTSSDLDNSNVYSYDFNLTKFLKLGDISYISNGLATLNDSVFLIKSDEIIRTTKKLCYFSKKGISYKISWKYLRTTYRPNVSDEKTFLILPNNTNDGNDGHEDFKVLNKYLTSSIDDTYYKKYGLNLGRSQGLKYYNYPKIVIPKVSNLNQDFRIVSYDCHILAGLYIVLKAEYTQYQDRILKYLNDESVTKFLAVESKNYASGYKSISTTKLKDILIPIDIFEGGDDVESQI